MKISSPIVRLVVRRMSCWLLFSVSLAAETAPVAPRGAGPEPAFPSYLGSFTDSLSGARVTRITGDQGQVIPNTEMKWVGRTRSIYNLKQIWSADEKLLFLGIGGPLVLDGETYQVFHSWGPPAPGTWHPVRPDVMIYVKDNAVCEWNTRSNVTRQLVRLAGYADFVQSSSEHWISPDGRLIGVTARREADGKDVGFLVDIDAGKRISIDFDFSEHGFARKEREYQVCRPSLSGKYVVLRVRGGDNGPNPRGEALTVIDLAGERDLPALVAAAHAGTRRPCAHARPGGRDGGALR